MRELPRRYGLNLVVFAVSVVLIPACTSDGHLSFGGYSSAPNYNCDIRTVYVPICQNKSFRRGLENTVTQAIIREIRLKTTFRTVDSPQGADSELVCTIVNETKSVVNLNQIGDTRDAQLSLKVEVFWKDLRPGHEGELLSGSGPRQKKNRDPNWSTQTAEDKDKAKPQPVIITPSADYIPELGMSNASAEQVLANNLAVQIVSMMEVWR